MRFLVITNSRESIPPEMGLPMIQAMKAWVAEHRSSGKMKDVWGFAGLQGGGGIIEADTAEELDEVMTGFPFLGSSDIDVYVLSDLDAALNMAERRIRDMMAQMGGGG